MKEEKLLRQIVGFPSTLFVTGNVYSQSSMQQGQKCGAQSYEAIDITVGDYFAHLYARFSALT